MDIGNPPITYPLQLDLASSDLLVVSNLCTSSSCPHVTDSTATYNPGRSDTSTSFNGNATRFNASFADGSYAAGFLGTDTVWLGGGIDGLPNQAIGVINQSTIDLEAEGISGILGLGFPRLSLLAKAGLGVTVGASNTTSNVSISATGSVSTTTSDSSALPSPTAGGAEVIYLPPPLQALVSANGSLPYPVFGLALANATGPYSVRHANATLTLGGVCEEYVLPDESANAGTGRMVSDIEWHPVVPFAPAAVSGLVAVGASSANVTVDTSSSALTDLMRQEYLYWALPLVDVAVGNTTITASPTYNATYTGTAHSIALLDIGFNGIAAPQQDVIALFSLIQDARQVADGQWAVPCGNNMSFSFAFATGADGQSGRALVLEPSDWLIGRVEDTSMCLAWPIVLPPSADGIDWQLGTPFLRKTYSIFSSGINGVQAPMVGFVPLPANQNKPGVVSANGTARMTMSSTSTLSTASAAATPLSSLLTTTIATELPNVLLPDPSFSTPAFGLETATIPLLGEIPTTGAADASIWPTPQPVPIVNSGLQSPSRNATSRPAATGTGSGGTAHSDSTIARAIPSLPSWVSAFFLFVLASCET